MRIFKLPGKIYKKKQNGYMKNKMRDITLETRAKLYWELGRARVKKVVGSESE